MKIALLTLSFWPTRGGMEFVVHDLANALHDLGHEVYVFAPAVTWWRMLVTRNYEEIDHRYSLVRFGWKLPGANRYGLNRLLLPWIFKRLHTAKPFDVINTHSAYLATAHAHDLKRRFGVPVVVTCQGGDIQRAPEIGYGARLDPAKDRIICRDLQRADRVVAISDSIYGDLVKIVPKEKIVRIPNGVDLGQFRQHRADFLGKRLGIQGGKIILSVGRNHPKKSFDVGLRAFALVAQQEPRVHYVHLGRDGESLQWLAEDLGVADRFYSLGEVERKQVHIACQEADIFFSPASVEGFSIANLEAMASGLPCVVTDGPGNRDSIVHGQNGWIVPVGDEWQMAQALLDLLRYDHKRHAFGQVSREIVAAKYSWPTVTRAYERVFKQCLEQNH